MDSAWSWEWRVEASREGNTSAKACEQVVRGLVAERHLARTAGGIRSMSKRKRIHEGRHWRADDCVESLSSNQRKTKSRRAVCEGEDVAEIEVVVEIEEMGRWSSDRPRMRAASWMRSSKESKLLSSDRRRCRDDYVELDVRGSRISESRTYLFVGRMSRHGRWRKAESRMSKNPSDNYLHVTETLGK